MRRTNTAVPFKVRDIKGEEQRLDFAKAMAEFLCVDKDVEYFLKNKTFYFEQRDFARTYLLLDATALAVGNIVILAYFTLSIKALHFLPSLSKSKIKEIDGFSKNVSSVGAILIGQFGKNDLYRQAINGAEIMSFAFEVIYDIFDSAACRIAFLECKHIDKLVNFYASCGFKILQDSNKGLLQMVRFL